MDRVLLNQKGGVRSREPEGNLFGNGLGFGSSSFARLIDLWTTAARR